jgi:carboxyl-terminal processing protease
MRLRMTALLLAVGILGGLTPCMGDNKDYLSTLETVWNTVNETYCDSTFGGLDWKAIHDLYQPQIAAAEGDEEFYRLINKMLWELKVSHANLVPPRSLALYEPLTFAAGSPGIDLRMLEGVAVITSVKPGSPADTAGLRPGYVIEAIDGASVEQIVKDAGVTGPPPYNDRGRTARITKAILGHVYGAAGTEVAIAYTDEGGRTSEKKVMRAKRNGVAVGPNGMMFLAVDFGAKRLDNGIGYIRLNTLQPPLTAQISSSIRSMGDIPGLILDLRGNSGGEIEKMPDLFLTARALLYLNRTRSGTTEVFFDPAADVFSGPLVLLVDATSGSACELFAASMQAIGRAAVVGERSPGSVMESDVMVFPNGAIFMYPVAQPITPDGTVLEGRGVVPNEEVPLDRKMLLKGIDSQLDSAIRYMEKDVRK